MPTAPASMRPTPQQVAQQHAIIHLIRGVERSDLVVYVVQPAWSLHCTQNVTVTGIPQLAPSFTIPHTWYCDVCSHQHLTLPAAVHLQVKMRPLAWSFTLSPPCSSWARRQRRTCAPAALATGMCVWVYGHRTVGIGLDNSTCVDLGIQHQTQDSSESCTW